MWKINLPQAMKILKFAIFPAFLAFMVLNMSACKTPEGCGKEEKYGAKTDKIGQLTTKKGSSNLFDNKRRKKMKG